MPKTTRLLLPFTHGIEMDTIDAAVLLAASHNATLIPLSLIHSPQASGKGARLEHIQQSKDFLEVVQKKAVQHSVPLERFELFTSDAVQSLSHMVEQLECDRVVLARRGQRGSLLSGEMIEQLIAIRSCPIYLLYLPAEKSTWATRLRERFSHWRSGHRGYRGYTGYEQRADEHVQGQPLYEEQHVLEVMVSQE